MSSRRLHLSALLSTLALAAVSLPMGTAAADAPETAYSAEQLDFFEKRIRPVLVEKCYECHSAEAGKRKGGLHVDNRQALEAGGDSGPAVKPGVAEASLLVEAISYGNPDLEMPPKERLPESIVEDFRAWVAMGAPDPREGNADAQTASKGIDYEAGRQFWSFQPVKAPPVPHVERASNSSTEIDRFLEARLHDKGLSFASRADKRTLIRRAYFDLTGLPPEPAEVEAFLRDESPDAFEKVVDQLLATRAFGETWGRHWLDVVRFAESTGGGRAMIMPQAWRFRDYVIDSFAQDKPFDEFIREHIAGDLLESASPSEEREGIIATGFLALGPTNYELQDKELLRMEVVDEQLDTIGRAFLGMTIGCARCHDHMFDPISAADYYAMAGILRGTRTLEFGNVSSWIHRSLPLEEPRPLTEEEIAKQADFEKQEAALRAELAAETVFGEKKKIGGKLINLTVKAGSPIYESAMSVEDRPDAADYAVAIRGDVHNLGTPVPRGFMTVAMRPDETVAIPEGQSGRLQFADWVASPENPLTARVAVNRIWHHLFGQGLVRTVDNFGKTGEAPSHPELLDWLAHDFVQDGWSWKQAIRDIMLTRAYQQSSGASTQARKADPENFLLSHQNRRRLTAESMRDTMLLLAGRLEPSTGGKTLPAKLGSEFDYDFDFRQRSVYMPVFRNNLDDLFEVFDFANPNLVVGGRSESTIPTQALYLMNSPFVQEQARHATSAMVLAQAELLDEEKVDLIYERTLCRLPRPEERELALRFLGEFPRRDKSRDAELEAWAALQQSLFAAIDFRYLD